MSSFVRRIQRVASGRKKSLQRGQMGTKLGVRNPSVYRGTVAETTAPDIEGE